MIPRDLLEHYLRATGWEHQAEEHRWCAPSPLNWRRIRESALQLSEEAGLPSIETLAVVEDRWQYEVASRLGMCAAAEQVRSEALRLVDTPACFVLARVADDLLKTAGIDPYAWEATR